MGINSGLLLVALLFISRCLADGCYLYASNLRVENQVNPLGMDVPNPRLSWWLLPSNSSCRNQNQVAYRVLVASSTTALDKGVADYWDSNEILANDTINVIYRGNFVPSKTRVYWKVIIWDNNKNTWDKYSDSTYGWWETPLLSPSDWQGKWIQRHYPPHMMPSLNYSKCDFFKTDPVPLFRREFALDSRLLARARLYVAALGYYEAYINGKKVGNNVLDPGFTTINQTILYTTYDITSMVNSSANNTIGIMLGNGWYNPLPMTMFGFNLREILPSGFPTTFKAQLCFNFVDGSSYTLGSDVSWEVGAGPLLFNNIYLGEIYDARLEVKGWTEPGFDSSSWPYAVHNVNNQINGRLVAQYAPPIRMFGPLPTFDRWTVKDENNRTKLVIDLGRNFAGWIQVNVSNGLWGQSIFMKYGEITFPNGTVNGLTTVAAQMKWPGSGGPCVAVPAYQTDTFILKGLKSPLVETYQQMFTWHAFRYVEFTTDSWNTLPDISVYGIPLHSDLEQIGKFESSNWLFNQIQQMVVNTILSNMFSLQSDCPGRERFGYGGDAHASDKMVMYNFDMSNFYRKRIYDFEDSSNYISLNWGFDQVIMPEVAPFVGFASASMGNLSGPIAWGTVFPQMQYLLYQFTGDTTLLQQQYEKGKGWLKFLSDYADNNNGTINIGLGDWMALDGPNVNFTSNVFYRYNYILMSKIAGILGQYEDKIEFLRKADLINAKINLDYLYSDVSYDNGGQAAQSFALWHNVVPSDLYEFAFEGLVNAVAAAEYHISTGMFSILYELELLSQNGRSDLAFEMINQTSYPGFGFMIMNGSTTIWEDWTYSNDTYSHNHVMFGSVSAWFIEYVAGISSSDTSVAFDDIEIIPQVVGDLEWAKGSYASVRGNITTNWYITKNNTLCIQTTIPPNTQATVTLPLKFKDVKHDPATALITESRIPISRVSPTIENRFSLEKFAQVFQVGSGTYEFCVTSQ